MYSVPARRRCLRLPRGDSAPLVFGRYHTSRHSQTSLHVLPVRLNCFRSHGLLVLNFAMSFLQRKKIDHAHESAQLNAQPHLCRGSTAACRHAADCQNPECAHLLSLPAVVETLFLENRGHVVDVAGNRPCTAPSRLRWTGAISVQ